MPSADVMRDGEHVMTVCNACRYCEGFCPVFPAMENRLIFLKEDLTYLANLCHNCGECLYSCQYAPPHEFALNVPATLARIRLHSYEEYCWPRPLGAAFKRHGLLTALAATGVFIALMVAYTQAFGTERLWLRRADGDFYRVIPHPLMIDLFGAVAVFVLAALVVGFVRFWRDLGGSSELLQLSALIRAFRDAVTLTHLHDTGVDCPNAEEARSQWRRWLHHCTFYGFILCCASTSVAALYHSGFGWRAPYSYASLPVLLGIAGGVGLLVGPIGLYCLRRRRDPALGDPAQHGMDVSFIALLVLTSLTGLLLLVARERAVMGVLLLIHLGFVLTLLLTLPYGKFVHGIYRTVALVKYAVESSHDEHEVEVPALETPTLPRRRRPATVKQRDPLLHRPPAKATLPIDG